MKILYGHPAYRGQLHALHVAQVASVVAAGAKTGDTFGVTYADSCSVEWSRNMLLHLAVRQGADWLLMCDADTVYVGRKDGPAPGGEILRMLHDGDRLRAAAIAAPVPMRGRPGRPLNVARVLEDGTQENMVPADLLGRVTAVDRIGTGFFAINARFIAALWPGGTSEPWFNGRQAWTEGRPGWEGEDYAFCDGVRALGGAVYCDGRIEPMHIDRSPDIAALIELGAVVADREHTYDQQSLVIPEGMGMLISPFPA